MNTVVGVELTASEIRAVALGTGGRRGRFGLGWDPLRPEEAVGKLRQLVGPARRLALSVGLAFLHVKRVKLPPAPAAARRRMLALEPDRFFPVQEGALAVALSAEEDFAFAVDAALLERWIRAFETWAPVDAVEAAPMSLQRALERDRVSGVFSVPAGPDEQGMVALSDGRFRAARRAPIGSVQASPLPGRDLIPGDSLCAWGAALGVHGPLDGMLVSDGVAARIRTRRVGRALGAGVACAAALVFALWAVDRSRERALESLRAAATTLTADASEAMDLQGRLEEIERERFVLGQAAGVQLDPLPVLTALSQRLPEGVTVLNLRAAGEEWQVDGTAPDAAAILPLLDADERFHDVRFLSASSRYREGDRTYETFSIAFRVRPTA